jgi:hypothetical protein
MQVKDLTLIFDLLLDSDAMCKYSPSLGACPQNIREALTLKLYDTGLLAG